MSASPSTDRREWHVLTLYRFADLPDCEAWRDRLDALCREHGVRGTLILGREGINGTVAGSQAAIDALLKALMDDARFHGARLGRSVTDIAPFRRLKVKVKPEIVTFGEAVNVPRDRGVPVPPADWNALIERPDVTVVDTRNDFEVSLGTFEGSADPRTEDFRDFPKWADGNLPDDRDAPVAMFCTGGVRCEKATAWLAQRGYRNLFHLEGGILRYLDEVPREETKWRGACFVFDERVAVGHGMQRTGHTLCRSCRTPLSPADTNHEDYDAEVSCPSCAHSLRPADRARRMERRDQAARAAARGQDHVGADLDSERTRKRREREAQRRRSLRGRSRSGRS